MRIAYLSNSIVPSQQANSVHVIKMCQAFARKGHEVTLYAVRGAASGSPFEWYGVEECFDIEFGERPRLRGWKTVSFALQTARRLRQRPRPDLIYARNVAALAGVARLGIPFIYEAHALPAHWARRQLERWTTRRPGLSHMVVISDALRRDYEAIFPELRGRIMVAHDGSDPLRTDMAPRSEWPGRAGALQAGFVGNLYPNRGIEVIFALAARMPEIDFHLIGGSDGDVRKWYDRPLPGNIHFHGFVPHHLIASCYAGLDLVLAPYPQHLHIARWMSPLKVFEYMAAEKAIVASDLPVLREVLHPMRTAVLVPPDDIESWQDALDRLSKDPVLRNAMAAAAHADFAAHHTWSKRAEEVVRLPPDPLPDITRQDRVAGSV